MAHIRNKVTGLSVHCGEKLADKYLANGWVLAKDYVAPKLAKATAVVTEVPQVDHDALAAAIVKLQAAAAAQADSSGGDESEGDPAGDESTPTGDEKPATRGASRRASK